MARSPAAHVNAPHGVPSFARPVPPPEISGQRQPNLIHVPLQIASAPAALPVRAQQIRDELTAAVAKKL